MKNAWMPTRFTYHLVNIKRYSDAYKNAGQTLFTYHLVNIKHKSI
ncbi:conserved hypothetical protein [Clostridioides difficile T61]|nr:conserved hypothetical protein [Clostridioides difficile E16]CCL96793.1 conserved hypothetical protein [Clostridioides difficile T61]